MAALRRPSTISTARRRPAWTVRVAVWSARHSRLVFVLWLVLTLGTFAASQAIGGMKELAATGGQGPDQTEAQKANEALIGGGAAQSETFTVVVTSTTAHPTDPAYRAAVESIVGRLKAVTVTENGATAPAFTTVLDPYALPASAGAFSPDGTSVQINGQIPGNSDERQARTRAIAPEVSAIQAAYPQFQIHAVALTLANQQISKVVNADLDNSLRITLPATFLILLIAFGAVVAAFVPLVLAISALLAAFGLLALYSQATGGVSPYSTQLVVLIGLAVAVDYSLFMITRFRSERRAGREKLGAIEVASATAGRAVLFSGIAVMISLAGLFLLPGSFFSSMALGAISVILVSVVGSLTFLPATLAILDRRIDLGSIPFLQRRGSEGHGFWAAITGTVVRHPIVSAVAAAAVLVALGSPVAFLRLGESDLSSFPHSVDSVQALDALQAHWPETGRLSLTVVVTGADTPEAQQALAKLPAAALAVPGLSGPAAPARTQTPSVAALSFAMAGSQNDQANWDIVKTVRSQVVPQVFGGVPNAKVYVGGDAAAAYDNTQVYQGAMVRIFAFVLGLSFLLLLLVFRSIAIPIKAVILNLLSTTAAYGVVVLIFEKGWLGSVLGVTPSEAIQNWVPIFIFTILFGLSMDYEVFILSRIKELKDSGISSHEAVARVITITSGTVTSAAAIMVVVFAVFVTLRLVVIRELGLGLAVAVFIDATLVRSVLLPATMRLLGDWNWYLPPFLRWLPRFQIESDVEPLGANGAETEPGAEAA